MMNAEKMNQQARQQAEEVQRQQTISFGRTKAGAG
jgi:hypothetical protein